MYEDILTWWDAGKNKIKNFFIERGIQKRRQDVNQVALLSAELQNIHNQPLLSTEQKRRKVAEIKFKLNNMQQKRINGSKIRSKILEIAHEEEKQTDFYRAEVCNATSKKINQLYKNENEKGPILSGKGDVINEVHRFYNKLWGTRKKLMQMNKMSTWTL